MAVERRPLRQTALGGAALALALGLTACGADVGAPAAAPTSSPSSASTTTPAPSPSEGEGTESPVTGGAPTPPESVVAEGGTTFADFVAEHPHSPLFDRDEGDILQEKLGTGEVSLTVDAQKGARYAVLLLCPSDASGKTDVYLSDGPGEAKVWMAGSEALCGDWSAELPPAAATGPQTITVTVDNDRPFRAVLISKVQ
ncbi:hypothetical protein [Micrococcus sp.]|uniref:hypothetical protein n=1 Tax=Micrococcus sp. TaxID=1271 RepID=UPI002A90D0AF|nr:hypothetical protein [Micrococcus sp.]MDY6054864.1 hypothetical protein [Micrococcus sp.]